VPNTGQCLRGDFGLFLFGSYTWFCARSFIERSGICLLKYQHRNTVLSVARFSMYPYMDNPSLFFIIKIKLLYFHTQGSQTRPAEEMPR